MSPQYWISYIECWVRCFNLPKAMVTCEMKLFQPSSTSVWNYFQLQCSIPPAYFAYMVWHSTGQHCSSIYACTYRLFASMWRPLLSVITTLYYTMLHMYECCFTEFAHRICNKINVRASSSHRSYLCAKFCFFCSLHCWASPRRKITCSINQSPSFSSSSVVSHTFSVLWVYSKFSHHLHPLCYHYTKFCFFYKLHCSASPWRNIAYSITQLIWCPENLSLHFWIAVSDVVTCEIKQWNNFNIFQNK